MFLFFSPFFLIFVSLSKNKNFQPWLIPPSAASLQADLREDGVVEEAARGHLGLRGARDEDGGDRGGERVLAVQVRRQRVPVLEADLEDLRVLHLRYEDQVVQRL